jgi:hypothetical protein
MAVFVELGCAVWENWMGLELEETSEKSPPSRTGMGHSALDIVVAVSNRYG